MERLLADGIQAYFNIIYWICVCYAITSILVEASITKYIRIFPNYIAETTRFYVIKLPMQFMYSLLNCFLCSSVWVSGIMSIFMLHNTTFYQIFIDAMFATTVLWFMHCIEIKLIK